MLPALPSALCYALHLAPCPLGARASPGLKPAGRALPLATLSGSPSPLLTWSLLSRGRRAPPPPLQPQNPCVRFRYRPTIPLRPRVCIHRGRSPRRQHTRDLRFMIGLRSRAHRGFAASALIGCRPPIGRLPIVYLLPPPTVCATRGRSHALAVCLQPTGSNALAFRAVL